MVTLMILATILVSNMDGAKLNKPLTAEQKARFQQMEIERRQQRCCRY